MIRSPRATGGELVAALGRAGFVVARVRGSHHFLRRAECRRTEVPAHSGETGRPGFKAERRRGERDRQPDIRKPPPLRTAAGRHKSSPKSRTPAACRARRRVAVRQESSARAILRGASASSPRSDSGLGSMGGPTISRSRAMSARRRRRARDRPLSSSAPVRTLMANTDSISTIERRDMMPLAPGRLRMRST